MAQRLDKDVGLYTLGVVNDQGGQNLTLPGNDDSGTLAAIDPRRQDLWLHPVGAVSVLTVAGRLTTAPWSQREARLPVT